MSDDIVTRLRQHVRGDYVMTADFMLNLAADEIERLRAENDGLRIRIYTLLKTLGQQAARRGDR